MLWWKKAALGAFGAFVISGPAQQLEVVPQTLAGDASKALIGAALGVVVSDAQAQRDLRANTERTSRNRRHVIDRGTPPSSGGGSGGSSGGSTGGSGGTDGGGSTGGGSTGGGTGGGSTIGGGCR